MKRLFLLMSLLMVCAITHNALAVILDFQCAGTGDWNVAANWEVATRTGVPDGLGGPAGGLRRVAVATSAGVVARRMPLRHQGHQ